MKRFALIILSLIQITLLSITTANAETANMQQYIDTICKKYHFKQTEMNKLMQHFHYNAKVLHSIEAPFEARPYGFYRHYFLSPERVKLGAHYWQQHQTAFRKEKKRFGVPANLITGIIGVETLYGKSQGTYNELDALTTLGFYYPPRATFFKHELTEFFLLTREQKLNPLDIKGSYAGALGIPQFMPDSYRAYAIDYNKNHHVDLMRSHADSIASIGNFLVQHGWHRNQPVAIKIQLPKHFPKRYIDSGLPKMHLLSALQRYQLHAEYNGKLPKQADVIAMQNKHGTEYWLVFPNFQAILGYNPNNNYALAVYELSQAIRKTHARL
ncbi:MAG: lytic murein transglycosylase B [Gammaproteobacteria bacterium]|nr:lytic murein transglycosylase B [Gammaproteobacteria bacterium]MCH9743367.1 lytic murein transglycosylase B [Gammaproteobacteria bacterium]